MIAYVPYRQHEGVLCASGQSWQDRSNQQSSRMRHAAFLQVQSPPLAQQSQSSRRWAPASAQKLVTDVLETQPLPHITCREPVLGQKGNTRVGAAGTSGQHHFSLPFLTERVFSALLLCEVLSQVVEKKGCWAHRPLVLPWQGWENCLGLQ